LTWIWGDSSELEKVFSIIFFIFISLITIIYKKIFYEHNWIIITILFHLHFHKTITIKKSKPNKLINPKLHFSLTIFSLKTFLFYSTHFSNKFFPENPKMGFGVEIATVLFHNAFTSQAPTQSHSSMHLSFSFPFNFPCELIIFFKSAFPFLGHRLLILRFLSFLVMWFLNFDLLNLLIFGWIIKDKI